MPFDIRMHIPLLTIAIPMIISMVYPIIHKHETCRKLSLLMYGLAIIASVILLNYVNALPSGSFTYMAGRVPAPWGNELRSGQVEALLALCFSTVMFLSVWGGRANTHDLMPDKKGYINYIMLNFLFASMMALIFTNDLFTAYVFIEINTIAACAIMIPKLTGTSMGACMKYLFMSMLGSGLFLLAICFLYSITGQLLMVPLNEAITVLAASGQFAIPLTATLAMFGLAIALKAGLFPFHAWFPDSYTYSPHSSSALLSGLVSKAYILIFIKIIFRVYGVDVFGATALKPILLTLGVIAMLIGSVYAYMQTDVKKMVSFSSVAQIGYIFVGIGINTQLGYAAAIFHIIFHAFTKSMLFISTGNLITKAEGSKIDDMTGMAYKRPVSAIAFWVGGLSMIGIPLFMGFITKLNFASAAFAAGDILILLALGISTCLNVLYFIPVMFKLYSKKNLSEQQLKREHEGFNMAMPLVCFIAVNIVLGVFQSPIMTTIMNGLSTLG